MFSPGLTSTLVEHLSQQLEEYKSELSSKLNLISGLQTELADKEEIIKDQMDTITDYREEMQRMEDNTFETSYCPVMENKRKARRSSRKTMRRKRRRLETVMCRDRSLESDSWSEPELGVSLARIGLPHSFPELPQDCNCDRNLLSESDDKQSESSLELCLSFLLNISFESLFFFYLLRQDVLLPCFPTRQPSLHRTQPHRDWTISFFISFLSLIQQNQV